MALRCVSLFYLNEQILGKDMFLAPFYLAKTLNAKLEFVYPLNSENMHLKDDHRGVKLIPIRSKSRYNGNIWTEKEMLWWLIRNSSKIDVLSLFWLTPRNILFANIYKFLNSKGTCYIKGDLNEKNICESVKFNKSVRASLKNVFLNAVDVLSVETNSLHRSIKNGALGSVLAHKVEYCPNAFDIDLYESYNFKKRTWSEKENLIISVGRIGNPVKNNMLVLKALENCDLKDWKFMFIGPIEEGFKEELDLFLIRNSQLKEKVILHGPAKDKRELWELYNAAKAFVLTSNKEGFPNVFPEALFFTNYIITTNVSSSSDITHNGTVGSVIPVGDREMLKSLFENFISKADKLPAIVPDIQMHAEKFIWPEAIKAVVDRIRSISHEKNS